MKMSYKFDVTVSTIQEEHRDEIAHMTNENALEHDKPMLMSGRTTTNNHSEHARVAHVCRKIRHKDDNILEESFTAVEIDGRIYGFCTTKYINHSDEYPLVMSVLSKDKSLDEVVGGDMAMCWYGWSDQYFNVREANTSDNFDLITRKLIGNMTEGCGIDPRYPLAAQAICRMFMKDREYLLNENYVV